MSRATVVIVNDVAHVNGGASKIAIASAIGLARRGWAVRFLAGTGPVAPEFAGEPGLDVRCLDQFEILHDPNRFRAVRQGLWSVSAETAMHAELCALDAARTVVHVHLWAKALSSSVVAAAAERGFPVLLTLHDYLYACPTGTLFDHGKSEVCTVKPMGVRCLTTNCDARRYAHKLWRTARHVVAHTSGRFQDGIGTFVALGEHSLAKLAAYLPPHAAVRSVPNFVDMDRPEPAPVWKNSRFIFSGRLVPEKGPLLAAQAAEEAGAALTMIGDGEQRALISRRFPAVHMAGWLDYARGLEALRGARALLLPSLWLEVRPLVVLEAAAHGIPVILPDTSAARDLVEDGVTGLWFRMGDARDLARKIALLGDPEHARRLGQAAYDRYWAAPPTLDRHLECLEAVYHEALHA